MDYSPTTFTPYDTAHPDFSDSNRSGMSQRQLKMSKQDWSLCHYYNGMSRRHHYYAPYIRANYRYEPETGMIRFRNYQAMLANARTLLARGYTKNDLPDVETYCLKLVRQQKGKNNPKNDTFGAWQCRISVPGRENTMEMAGFRYAWLVLVLTDWGVAKPDNERWAPASLPIEPDMLNKDRCYGEGNGLDDLSNPWFYRASNLSFKVNENMLEWEAMSNDMQRYLAYYKGYGWGKHYDNDYGFWLKQVERF